MPPVAAHDLNASIEAQQPALVELRHDLHRHPQLAYQETHASEQVQRWLRARAIAHETGFAHTGVVGCIEPTDDAARRRPAVALRADMDALPITEQTGLDYASQHDGLMHACGHDGHTTILLGAASVLHERRAQLPRPVKLIFQPAEEGAAGGKKLVDAGVLTDNVLGHRAAHVFGLHGWPQLPLGHVGCAPGPVMASMDNFTITVHGRGAHGAAPHLGVDPIVAGAHIVAALQTIVSRHVDPTEAAVVTVGTFQAGQASNIIPEAAELTGTIRAMHEHTARAMQDRVRDLVQQTAVAHECRADVDIQVGYPPTRNDKACADYVLDTARHAIGDERTVAMARPSMAAEDFAFYQQHVPGAFYFLGLCPRERDGYPGLHTPQFDFNDEAIPTGVRLMCELALGADALPDGDA